MVHAGGGAWAAVGKGKLVPGCQCDYAGGPCALLHHPRRTAGLRRAWEYCLWPLRMGRWGRSRALPSHTGKGSVVQEKRTSAQIRYRCCNLFNTGLFLLWNNTIIWKYGCCTSSNTICVTEAFLCFGDAWGRIREEEANAKQWIFTLISLYLCTKITEGKNLRNWWKELVEK